VGTTFIGETEGLLDTRTDSAQVLEVSTPKMKFPHIVPFRKFTATIYGKSASYPFYRMPQVLKLCSQKVRLLIIVDRNEKRAAKTAEICKVELGVRWLGEVVDFTTEYRLKCWAWENRARMRETLGGHFLHD